MPNKVVIPIEGKNKTKPAFKGVEKDLNKLDRKVSGLSGKFKSSFGSIGATLRNHKTQIALAMTAAVGSMGYLIKKTVDQAEAFEKMSQRVGVSVEDLSTLKFAAELSGASIESLEKSIGRASRNVFDYSQGIGEAKVAFEALGVTAFDTSGELKDADAIIMDIADQFEEMEDGTKKTALAMQIFGRAGTELIPMLNKGAKGIRLMKNEARALGLEISTNMAVRAADFKDNMLRIDSIMSGVGINITTQMLPALVQLTGAFSKFAQNGEMVMLLGQGLGMSLKLIGTILMGIGVGATAAAIGLGTFWAAAAKVITGKAGEIPFAINEGLKVLKTFADTSGGIWNALWGEGEDYTKLLEDFKKQQALVTHAEQIKSLERTWKTTAETLQNDILKNGMDPQSRRLFDLNVKANQLKEKFGEIPGALVLINEHLDLSKDKIAQMFINENFDRSVMDDPTGLMQIPGQLEYITAAWDQYAQKRAEVTGAEVAHLMLMSGTAQATFGNMAAAMFTFYEMSGRKSKEAFAVYKATAIAEAIAATYMAANKALGAGVGPPWTFVLMGSVIAAGLANVAKIASASPGGGYAGQTYQRAPLPPNYVNQSTNTSTQTTQAVTVIINGDIVDPDRYFRDNADSINKAIGDGLIVGPG